MYVLFFVALFFVIGIALSYAYLGVNAINTSTKSNLGSSLQCMNISYSESDILDLDYNFPVKDSYALANIIPVNITVTNNCPSGEGIVTYTLAISSLFKLLYVYSNAPVVESPSFHSILLSYSRSIQ